VATKSRQAVIARAPRCLAIHINRSVFDEYTGTLEKFFELIWHLFASVFSLKSLPSKAVLTASNREWADNMALEPIEGVECAKCTLLHRQDQLINLISGFEAVVVEILFFELIWHLFASVFSLKSLPSKAVLTASNSLSRYPYQPQCFRRVHWDVGEESRDSHVSAGD
jgi:uncharacterized protein (DUF488 family)